MKTIIFVLLSITLLNAKETYTLNSNIKIFNLNINELPKCSNYKKLKGSYIAKSITLPLFNYKNKIIGTSKEMMIFKDRYSACRENNIIKFRHIESTELEHIKDNKISK